MPKAPETQDVRDLVDYMVRDLVDYPDDLSVVEVEGSASVLLELRAHDDDLSTLKGPGRDMIRSIQSIVSASGGARKIVVDLVEDADGEEE